jgi:hypothetical protein
MRAALAQLRPAFEHRLYLGTAAAAALIVVAGFARSYYLKGLFGAPALPLLLHVHGAVMTLWYVLFLAQVGLVAAHRTDLHRMLGVATAAVAFLLVIVGSTTAVHFITRFGPATAEAHEAAAIAGFDAVLLMVFAALVGTALAYRRRGDVHKRLMTLASLSLLGPPLARLISDESSVIVADCLVLVPVVIDTVRHRRLHPAFGWGGLLVVACTCTALALVPTASWTNFAIRMVS